LGDNKHCGHNQSAILNQQSAISIMATRLLIDGYNLLFASGVFASSAGPPTLERTRNALLQFLADSLEERLRIRTTVVFDATHAPPGLPHEMSFAGMRVLFSRNPADADALLEDLLETERAPREVLLVSSDHRVQRAARQRGAKYIDSDAWLRELEQARRASENCENKPGQEAWEQSADLQAWLHEFADVDPRKLSSDEVPRKKKAATKTDSASSQVEPVKPVQKPAKPKVAKKSRKPLSDEKPSSMVNPFPPGYGEDIGSEDV
jgi:predicted RNA-binding protein with PIN domain